MYIKRSKKAILAFTSAKPYSIVSVIDILNVMSCYCNYYIFKYLKLNSSLYLLFCCHLTHFNSRF